MKKVPNVHSSAVIEKGAQIADSAIIGPFCHVGPNVTLGERVHLRSHVVVGGHTTIGADTIVYPFASLGLEPQDLKFKGEKSTLTIGEKNLIREYVTMNPGTEGGGMKTVVGDGCLFMVGAHVAHDCIIGNRVILANNATLAGHVIAGDYAFIGGLSAVHQFVRIGPHAMIGGMSGVEMDVIPYGLVKGERASLAGLNLVGLKRRNFEREAIHALRGAYRMLFSPEGELQERITDAEDRFGSVEAVQHVLAFMKEDSSRGLCVPSTMQDSSEA